MGSLVRKPRLWWILFALWWGFLLYSSSRSAISPELIKTFGDKLIHAVYFAIGGTAFFLALRLGRRSMRWPWPLVALLTVALISGIGRLDEWQQSFTPGRRGNDMGDWIADSAGGLLALLVGSLLFYFLGRSAKA